VTANVADQVEPASDHRGTAHDEWLSVLRDELGRLLISPTHDLARDAARERVFELRAQFLREAEVALAAHDRQGRRAIPIRAHRLLQRRPGLQARQAGLQPDRDAEGFVGQSHGEEVTANSRE